MTMIAWMIRALAGGADAPIDLLRQAGVNRVEQISDVVFNVRALDVLSAEVSRIYDFEQIAKNRDDGRLIGQRCRSEVFEFRLQSAERSNQVTGDVPDLIAFLEILVHAA